MSGPGMIVLTTLVEPEGDKYVSWCEELGTASCGDTVEEAFANILEAVEVHLNGLEEVGETERVFEERGIKVLPNSSEESTTRPVPLEKIIRISRVPVPVPA